MITLIIGTPDSGKSLLAESICEEQSGSAQKYYIATMVPFGDEGKKRVEKHRKMRAGKGFITLEWPDNIEKRLAGNPELDGKIVLLECISNLVGNEMHSKENPSDEYLLEKILSAVRTLAERSASLTIVSNQFQLEDEQYDADTRRYVGLIAKVNSELIALADSCYYRQNGEWKQYEVD